MKNTYLELMTLSQELWNTRKALEHLAPRDYRRTFQKMESLASKIKALDFESENNMLKEIYVAPI